MVWNPFAALIETNSAYSSRFLRTSILQKIKDTFRVFYGDENIIGILDYLFPLARISFDLFSWLWSQNNFGAKFFAVLTFPFMAVFGAIKFLAAIVLTTAVSPIVGMVHLAYLPQSYTLSVKLQQIPV